MENLRTLKIKSANSLYLVDDSKFRKAFKVEATRLETGLESAARWNFNQAKKI